MSRVEYARSGWWRARLVGGPHDGKEAPLSGPYPIVDVAEGRYRRRDRPADVEGRTLVYEWEADRDQA